MRIAVVACGYADGYPRHAPDGTPVIVKGHKTQLVGRISMDMLTIDVTDLPDVEHGSPVELWEINYRLMKLHWLVALLVMNYCALLHREWRLR